MIPPLQIAHYRITAKLGEGGMGAVYRATDTQLNREVAIKVLPDFFASDPGRLARFSREAQVLAALNHPNIAIIHGIEQNAIVMELVDGNELKGPLPLAIALDYAAQIASALESAHEKGIIHRDLKPANIKIKPDGTVKVLDFGVAKVTERNVSMEDSPTLTMGATGAGAVIGTAAYMAPEQAAGKVVDRRADIWSFGVVLWEMLTGRRLFSAKTTPETLSKVLLGEIDLEGLPAETPKAIRQLLGRCLDRDVKNRLRDIGEARYLLSRPSEAHFEPSTHVEPRRSFRAGWVVLAAIPPLIALLGLYRLSMEPQPAASHRFLPFATEGHGEKNPVWSPDGRTIAYVASIDGKDQIHARATNVASSFKIAECPAICDVVGWSGDGARVYYQSRSTHLDARVWSVGRSGGAPAPLFQEDLTVLASAVSPDGRRLAMIQNFVDEKRGRMARLFLSEPPGAVPTPVEAFPIVNLVQYHVVAWFADADRFLVFSPAADNTLFLVSASQKTVRRVAVGIPSILGLTWSRDSRFALAALRPVPEASGLYWFNVDTGRFSPFRLSELPVTSVAVAPDGLRLAYTVAEDDLDLMEIPLDGSPVRPLLASRLRESGARYSPLSDEFAYVTADQIRIRQPKSRAERVAVSDADFPADAVRGDFRHPAFSPDGLRIAYNKRFKIWISPANGGQAVPLDEEGGQFGAEWSPDGVWLAYNSAHPRGSGLFKRRVGSNEPKIRLTDELCGAGPAWSPDGAWIACSQGMGMSLIPVDGGPPKHVAGGYEPHAVWSRDSEHLYLIRQSGDRREVGKLSWRTGTFQPLNRLPPDFVLSGSGTHAGRISLSYDGRALVTTVARATGDIWILDGFRPPRPFWKRMLGLDQPQVPSDQTHF